MPCNPGTRTAARSPSSAHPQAPAPRPRRSPAAEDYALSNYMVSYYSNFVKTGNPNRAGLPKWEPARKENKNVMLFDIPSPKMGKVSMPKLIKTMLTNKAVGE